MPDRKQPDRHYRSPQVPVGARLDKPDFDALETRRKALGMNRRQAIIAAIREWAGKPVRTETAITPEEAAKLLGNTPARLGDWHRTTETTEEQK